MITGLKKSEVDIIIETLEKSEYHFVLTGSRFFGTADQNSDWDFVVEDDGVHKNVMLWLEEQGFRKESRGHYGSANTRAVYQRGMVHIQVVTDLEWQQDAQRILEKSRVFKRHHGDWCKETRKEVWNLVYEALNYQSIKEAQRVYAQITAQPDGA